MIRKLGIIAGTPVFGWVLATRLKMAAAGVTLAGLGFVMMKLVADYNALTVGGLVNGLGIGSCCPRW